MLRMLMRDTRAPVPDQRFIAMMKDFAATWAGRDATTEDFEQIVQKHFVPQLNARGDGRVDWFFDQWVYGQRVPILSSDVQIEKAGKGKYRLHGTLTQSGVPDDFVTLVGSYVDFGKGQIGQFGRSAFKGEMTRSIDITLELPKKPKKVLINAFGEVLAFDS